MGESEEEEEEEGKERGRQCPPQKTNVRRGCQGAGIPRDGGSCLPVP